MKNGTPTIETNEVSVTGNSDNQGNGRTENYPHLFTPLKIGSMTLPNRVAMVPTDICSANADGSVNDRVITFHEEIAKGGCGFIIVGATTPDKTTGRPTVNCLAADEDPMIPGLARLAEAMHRHGAKCAIQIQHPGRQSAWPRKDLISCSDQVVDIPGSAGHEVIYADSGAKGKQIRAMSVEEVYGLIEKFAEAAWRVKEAGFDTVELHGAHGYLIAQFMSPYVNKRNDRFGGSFINRMRFPLEIIARIKMKCGKDFPIGIRYSGEEWLEGARNLEESIEIAKIMEEAGVAYLDISAGIFEAPAPVMDPMYYNQGWNTYTSEEIKKNVSIPVITSHTLRDPDYCEKILEAGKTDIVGLSRQMIADPYWANKSKAGQKHEIRKCISCLVGCWQDSLMIKRHMRCAINPSVGDERFIHLQPAKMSHNIGIIGGGPAGMEAARVATLRGHKVTLFEKSGELGGAILSCCPVQGKNKMKWYADWARGQNSKLEIDVRLKTEPTVKDLLNFDMVILATGSRIKRPQIEGLDSPIVTTAKEALTCVTKGCKFYYEEKLAPCQTGDTVLIWGDHFGAADSAEKLSNDGKKVYIVTNNSSFASWMEPCHKDVMEKRFTGNAPGGGLKFKGFKHPVTVITSSTVTRISDTGEVTLMDSDFKKSTLTVDNVILADVEENNTLADELQLKGIPAQKIGDCKSVHNLKNAVAEGANIGLTLDDKIMMNANNVLVSNLPTEITV